MVGQERHGGCPSCPVRCHFCPTPCRSCPMVCPSCPISAQCMYSCFHWTVYNIIFVDVHTVDLCLHVTMVRTYIRKSNRAQYSRSDMLQALTAIRNGEMSRKRASSVFSIPRTTLIKNLKRPISCVPQNLGRFKPVFDQDMENELVMHVVEMQQRFYGLSLMELRSISYELAHRNGIHQRQNGLEKTGQQAF